MRASHVVLRRELSSLVVVAVLASSCGTAAPEATVPPAPVMITFDGVESPVTPASVTDGMLVAPTGAELVHIGSSSGRRSIIVAGPESSFVTAIDDPRFYRADITTTLDDGSLEQWVLDASRPFLEVGRLDPDVEQLRSMLGSHLRYGGLMLVVGELAAVFQRHETNVTIRAEGPGPVVLHLADVRLDVGILPGADARPAASGAAWLQPGPAPGDRGAALIVLDEGGPGSTAVGAPERIMRGGVRTEHSDGSIRHWESPYYGPVDYQGVPPRPLEVLRGNPMISELRGAQDRPVLLILSGDKVLALREVADPAFSFGMPSSEDPGPTVLRFGDDELEVVPLSLTSEFVPLVAATSIGWVSASGTPGQPRRTMLVAGASTELARHVHTRMAEARVLDSMLLDMDASDPSAGGGVDPLDGFELSLEVDGLTQRWVPVPYLFPMVGGFVSPIRDLLHSGPSDLAGVELLLHVDGSGEQDHVLLHLQLAPSTGGSRGYIAEEDPHYVRLVAAMDRYSPFDWRRYVRDLRVRPLPDASGRVTFNSTWDGSAWRISGRHLVEFHNVVGNWPEALLQHVVLHELAHVWQAARWGSDADDSRARRVRDLWGSVADYPSLREECVRQGNSGQNLDRCLGLEIVADCLAAYWGSTRIGSYVGRCSDEDVALIGAIYEANALAPPPAEERPRPGE